MPQALLPSSATAFAPRKPPIIVLDAKIPPWLTVTLKRVKPARRRLKTPERQIDYLREILSLKSATWTLCSMMLGDSPKMIHVNAYVVHVDMVSRDEVSFKLTKETISTIEGFYKEFLVDSASHMWNYTEKQAHLKLLQEEFVKAANEFVYRTNAKALEGLEEDGSGELLCTSSEDIKGKIIRLFVPLEPPSHTVHIIRPLSGGNMPEDFKPAYFFEDDSWGTQSDIRTLSTEEQLASSYGNSLHVSDAGLSPVGFVGSQLFTAVPVSTANASFDMPVYLLMEEADTGILLEAFHSC